LFFARSFCSAPRFEAACAQAATTVNLGEPDGQTSGWNNQPTTPCPNWDVEIAVPAVRLEQFSAV
jgi:hypothetical protein